MTSYLSTQCFIYLEFVKYQLGLYRNVQVFAKRDVYSCFIYKHVQAFFLYRNKSYIFPSLGLAKHEYSSPYYNAREMIFD